jgi:hypothetical protein
MAEIIVAFILGIIAGASWLIGVSCLVVGLRVDEKDNKNHNKNSNKNDE